MSTSNSIFAISLQPTSVHAARIAQGRLEACREVVLEDKAALDALLAEVTPGWQGSDSLVFGFTPDKVHYHLSSVEQARQHRTKEAIASLSKGLPHGFSAPLRSVHCSAIDGASVQPKGDVRWVAAMAEESAWTRVPESFPTPLPPVSKSLVGGLATLGALVSLAPSSGSILALELGLSQGTLFVLGRKGVEGVIPVPIGFEHVFDAVQSELGLKFRGSAARLFHNAQYDFSEFGAKIASRLIPAIQASAKSLPQAGSFCVLNLMVGQKWFAKELSAGLGLQSWELESSAIASAFKLQLPADFTPSPAFAGLLQLASQSNASWLGNWETGFPEPALAAAPAPAPVKAVAAVTAAPKKEEKPEPKAVIVPVTAPAPSSAPAKAEPAKPETAKTAPVTKAETSKKVVAPAAAAKPEPAKAAEPRKEAPKPAEFPKKEASKPVESAAKPAEKPKAAPAPVSASANSASSASSLAYPGASAKKGKPNMGLYIGVGVVVLGALGFAGYTALNSKNEEMAKERKESQEKLEEKDRQAKLTEEKMRKEMERTQREAEKAREEAVAKAKEEADRRARSETEQQMKEKFLAETPGVLLVTTEPTNALVSVDDGVSVRTPLTRTDLKPGQHRIKVSLPGYDDYESTIQISATQTTDTGMIKLVRQAGDILVNSTPPGMDYVVSNGSEVISQGKTPATLKAINLGEYSVSIVRPGWPRYVQSVSVKKSETEKVSADFPAGTVVIQSAPSGADVLRNGIKIGVTPLRLTELMPGKMDLALDLKGYDRTPLSGEIVGGKEVVLTAELLDPNRIAKGSEVKIMPSPVETDSPRFSPLTDNQVARAVVSAVVRKDATVTNVKVESSNDAEFGRACAEALSHWKFKPGLDAAGKPLNVRIRLPFSSDNGSSK